MQRKSVNIKPWSHEDIEFFKKHYPITKTSELSKLIGRSVSCIHQKANKFGLKKLDEIRFDGRSRGGKASTKTQFKRIHGRSSKKDQAYETWCSMIRRCTDKNHKSYSRYGGRGITVCQEWKESFVAFISDMGEPSKGKTIGRIDNDANYTKENCRWETWKEQANNRSSNKFVTINGQRKTVSQWAEIYCIKRSTIEKRLKKGWDNVTAITAKVRQFSVHNQYFKQDLKGDA